MRRALPGRDGLHFVLMVILLLVGWAMPAEAQPRCENCQPVQRTFFECLHYVGEPNGTPCSTTACIENVLATASCQSFPTRSGAPNCNTDVGVGAEAVQRVRASPCPAQTINWSTFLTVYAGCGTACTGIAQLSACEIQSCTGQVTMGPFNRGQRKKCGCN